MRAQNPQEVRLHEVQSTRSYFPAWLQRSRLPSAGGESEEGGAALRTPNLANTIHGSLHGGTAFASQRWGAAAQPAPPPASQIRAASADLNVLGAPSAQFPLKDVRAPSQRPFGACL